MTDSETWFHNVVVIMPALQDEGPRFEAQRNHIYIFIPFSFLILISDNKLLQLLLRTH